MATLKEFKVGEEGNTIFDTSNYTSQFITTNPTDEDGNVFQGPPTKFELDNPDLAKQMISLFSKKNKKVPMDDKSYILEDGISSLKWGHHAIPSEKNIFGSCNNVAIPVC